LLAAGRWPLINGKRRSKTRAPGHGGRL
jgi:hypothetical protein